ncbi:MAG: hypothetical protein GXN96_01425 [Aquificae bacterium]|nr:hypothetical protein [Aquificota bacterium]
MRTIKGFEFNPGLPKELFQKLLRELDAPVETLFVNGTTGSDTNAGTESQPLKTFDKALFKETFPEEFDGAEYTKPGLLVVSLSGGTYQLNPDWFKILFGKTVYIWGDPASKPVIIPQTPINLLNSALIFDSCIIDNTSTGRPLVSSYNGNNFVAFNRCEIKIGSAPIVDNRIPATIGVSVNTSTITKTSTGVLLSTGNSTFDWLKDTVSTIQDSAGSTLTDADIILGIVRDAGNLPRNCRSNVVL